MAATYLSDQTYLFVNSVSGIALPGLTGAPQVTRATEVRGLLKTYHFTIEQDSPNPMPGQTATTVASGDIFIIAYMKPTDWIYFGRLYWTAWGGTNVLAVVGKIDPNNSTNTDNDHYLGATALLNAGTDDLDLNLPEQVGDDPAGDQSVGNTLPEFGAQDIQITLTIAASALDTGGTIRGFLMVVEEGN